MRRLNLLSEFTLDYYQNNLDSIDMDFWPDEIMIADFLAFGESKGLEYTEEELEESMLYIQVSLARDIISRKFGEQEGFVVGMQLDTQLLETMKLFDEYKTTEDMFKYATSN